MTGWALTSTLPLCVAETLLRLPVEDRPSLTQAMGTICLHLRDLRLAALTSSRAAPSTPRLPPTKTQLAMWLAMRQPEFCPLPTALRLLDTARGCAVQDAVRGAALSDFPSLAAAFLELLMETTGRMAPGSTPAAPTPPAPSSASQATTSTWPPSSTTPALLPPAFSLLADADDDWWTTEATTWAPERLSPLPPGWEIDALLLE